MGKKFRYRDGYIGTVSDRVAEILVKKGFGDIVTGEKAEPPKKPEDKK